MSTAVLSLGSNIGDSIGHLRTVVDLLGDRTVARSSIYRTAPWGGVEQADFHNAVVIARDETAGPRDWLNLAFELERGADRVRTTRWGPRTLDVDVITCDDVRSDDPELTLPHPRAHLRAFVLIPWLEIGPGASLPVDGRDVPIAELLARLTPAERDGVLRCDDGWDVLLADSSPVGRV